MKLRVPREQDVIQEALLVLEQNLELSKVALLLSQWQSSNTDYLALREDLFKDVAVKALGQEILDFEVQRSTS